MLVAVIDTETTGVQWWRDYILQLGLCIGDLATGEVLTVRTWNTVSWFSVARLKELGGVSPTGLSYHGLYSGTERADFLTTMRYKGESLGHCHQTIDALREMGDMVVGAALAAYNADFDRQMIAAEVLRKVASDEYPFTPFVGSGRLLDGPWLDPCVWARHQGHASNKLADVAERLGIEHDSSKLHLAGDDAKLAFQVMHALYTKTSYPNWPFEVPRLDDPELYDLQELLAARWNAARLERKHER